jgi:hypothetical protein
MRVKRWLLAGIALCLLTGMRDPFKPPEDLCRISELSQWRYQGMVGRGERIIGVIKDGQKINWRVHQYAFPSASPSAMAKSPPGGGSGG